MPADFTALIAELEQGVADGLHLGAQAYISRHGVTLLDTAVGEARPGIAMTTDTLTLWMSSGKPITAIALARLWESTDTVVELDLDDPVATYLPEFGQHGKGEVTLLHVLTHTGGFRASPFRFPDDDFSTIVEKVCAMHLEKGWAPGEKAGYHVHSGWYVLAEVVQRIAGEPFSAYVRGAVLEPMGMTDSWLGMDPAVYEPTRGRLSRMFDTSGAAPELSEFHEAPWVTGVRPGGNAYGPARELGRFYEVLLDGGRGVLQPETVREWTTRHREGLFDHTFKHVMDWGLGFILNSAEYGADTVPYGYGTVASREAFGHSGNQSSVAFADPGRGLAVAIVCNGMPGEAKHQARARRWLAAMEAGLTAE